MTHGGVRAKRQIALFCAVLSPWLGGYVEAQSSNAPISAISTQPLTKALAAFAKQTGLQLVYVSGEVNGMTSEGAPPGLSPRETLTRLLAGTGLTFEFLNERTVRIFPTPAPVHSTTDSVRHEAPDAGANTPPVNDTGDKGMGRSGLMGRVLGLFALCGSAAYSNAACAQQAAGADTLQEVVVTAEKRSESLSQAPLSVAVVSGATAVSQGDTQLSEALSKIGAVKVLEGQDGPTFYIRGVGTGVPSNVGDPEVNFNIDGVYQSEPQFSHAGLYDVDRIEVLRGPQGTLYGRNALAGAINIVTTDPTFDFGGYGSVGFGNYALIQTQGAINLPLSDTLALRFAFGNEQHSGYLTNGADDANVQSERIKLLWKPNDAFSLLLGADITHQGGAGEGEVQVNPPPPGFPTGTSGLGNSVASSNPWTSPDPAVSSRSANFWSVHAQADWDLGFGVLTVLPAYRDYDYTCSACYRSETDQNQHASEKQTTVEVRLASPAASTFKWLGGVYYLNAENPETGYQLGPGADSFSDASGNSVSSQAQTHFNSQSYAAFGQATYPIIDSLRVTLGGRYTNDKKSETGYVASETGGVTTTTTGLFTTSKSWDQFTYKAGLEYDLMSHWILYGNVSSGYKSGGFYQGAAPDSYNPENLTAYEVGSKGIYLDGRLEINADAFYYNYKDYQINYIGFINPASAGIFGILTANSEGATAYGGEVEARWLITPNDQFDVSIDPLHAHFKTLVITGIFGGDYSGLPLPFAPSFSSNLGLQHAWPLSNGAKLTARAETHIESGSWVTFSEVRNTYEAAYTLSNIFLTLDAPSRKFSISAYVKNLENKAVLANGQSGPAMLETVDLGPPRTWGVQISARF
jgi:iron complex outermembrane receptor protein